eukprot:CAMPEP_0119016228 /NCGR_PEP_ID=MMETSP1176-20130426/11884_1 /TAXON_ID=265551 /ORGANISM="Synedropsis recta cf, Strain CCMP1620" /LENGTH=253 /DNA_ID=CAMNT_0006969569 /DNA_START=226 /DNA_END=987 /DNA_ORIENTATION=-
MTAAAATTILSKPTLRYFMFPGRCYAARVALYNAFGKEGWVDERIGWGKYKKLKEEENGLVMGQLPELRVPGNNSIGNTNGNGFITVTQSHAIARWAARQNSSSSSNYNLYPEGTDNANSNTLLSCLIIDEAMALTDSIIALAPKPDLVPDDDERLQKRKDYSAPNAGYLYKGMKVLENRLLEEQASGPFLLGHQLSIGDLYIKKPLVDMILDEQFEGVPPDYLEEHFPLLLNLSREVEQHDLVVDYLTQYKN